MKVSRDELVLYLQCLNELLRGFVVDDFETMAGATKAELLIEDANLREIERSIRDGATISEIYIRTKVIETTMNELGHSEFQTRTGFELTEAQELVTRAQRNI